MHIILSLPEPKPTRKNCSYDCIKLFTQHSMDFLLILQTIITAQMLSIEGQQQCVAGLRGARSEISGPNFF